MKRHPATTAARSLQAPARPAQQQSEQSEQSNPLDRPEQQPKPLPQALLDAVELLRNEHIDEAEPALEAILRRQPRHSDALHFLGVLRHMQGRVDDAVALIRQSLTELPRNAGAWNNLGNVLLLAERTDEAVQAYDQAVAHADDAQEAALALNNLCTLHRKLGALDRSEVAARDALARLPDFADAWYGLSLTLLKQGRVHDGVLAHSKAVALWPQSLQPRHEIIRALMLLGELPRAAGLLREWLAENADNAVAQHLLSACDSGAGEGGGGNQGSGTAPERASDGYVQQVFDSFAASFDAKLDALGYRAPALVVQALQAAVGPPAGTLAICDAGCGTGLCGAGLLPFARHLAGCDLSVGMLRRARLLNHYHVLHQAELTHYLDTQPGAFDAVVSADTLCYFGALEGALAAAWRALKPGGWLVFTVEALPAERRLPHLLQPSGRYAHADGYLAQALQRTGFDRVAMARETLRMEAGEGVAGWVVSARQVGGWTAA